MTHQPHPNVTRQIVQLLSEQGFEGMAEAMQQLLNECMKIERQQALGVGPYQRGEERCGQANGFKPKTVKTRLGPLAIRVPQVRGAAAPAAGCLSASDPRGDSPGPMPRR